MSGSNAGRWSPHDRAGALERLANARANLAGLERRDAPTMDPEIQAAVIERQQQIESLRAETGRRGRTGRQVRQHLEALEGTQGLVMECLGYRTFEEFCTAIERFDASRIDSRRIAAARAEVDQAERHFFDTAEMKIPVPSSPPPAPAPARQQPAAWGQPQGQRPPPRQQRPQPAGRARRWAAS